MALSITDLIMKYKNEYDYCEKEYLKEWDSTIVEIDENASESKKTAARREAQKVAIDNVFVQAMKKFPELEEETIWMLISLAHKLKIARLDEFELNQMQRIEAYERCISAHQSWNKASGHSFERYIANIDKKIMEENEVKFILKSDATKMIKAGKMYNHPDDLHLIEEWNDNFDLYAIQTNHGKAHIFGCIQVKTSIRDRVGRDDQFSKNAMEKNFWVAEAVLNGEFFKMPKYDAMVNGGSTTYPENNWHGVYVMAGIESKGRIYHDVSFEVMARHAVIAADCFCVNRAQLTRNWKAE